MEMPEKHTPHLAAVLGANIAGRRQILGMNQADLAARLDMAPDALSRIENGYTAPRFGRIEQIAAVLECSPAELFREHHADTHANAICLEEMLSVLSVEQQEELMGIIAKIIRMLEA